MSDSPFFSALNRLRGDRSMRPESAEMREFERADKNWKDAVRIRRISIFSLGVIFSLAFQFVIAITPHITSLSIDLASAQMDALQKLPLAIVSRESAVQFVFATVALEAAMVIALAVTPPTRIESIGEQVRLLKWVRSVDSVVILSASMGLAVASAEFAASPEWQTGALLLIVAGFGAMLASVTVENAFATAYTSAGLLVIRRNATLGRRNQLNADYGLTDEVPVKSLIAGSLVEATLLIVLPLCIATLYSQELSPDPPTVIPGGDSRRF